MSFDLRKQRQTLFGQNTDYLIGELLLKAGVVKQNQLNEALKLAGNNHMQVGQMLIMARYVSPQDLQAALEAQSAIRNRSIESNAAVQALTLACRSGITFAEAVKKQSQEKALDQPNNPVGQLLLESGWISQEQFNRAIQKTTLTGLPLGRMLILNGVITEPILSATLEAQIRLGKGIMSQAEAIGYLRELSKARKVDASGTVSIEESQLHHTTLKPIRQKGLRLGELFVQSEILTESDVMNALEVSLVNEQFVGQVLVEHGYITEHLLDCAIKLQTLMDTDCLDNDKAIKSLHDVHFEGISLAQAIEKNTNETADGTQVDFQGLLTNSRLISSDDIQTAFELAIANPRILTKVLALTGYLNEVQTEIVLDCYEAVVHTQMSQRDALFVLQHCLRRLAEGPITFAQALRELGWLKQTKGGPSISQSAPPVPVAAGSPISQMPSEIQIPPMQQIPAATQFPSSTQARIEALNQPVPDSAATTSSEPIISPTASLNPSLSPADLSACQTSTEPVISPAAALRTTSGPGKSTPYSPTGKTTSGLPALDPETLQTPTPAETIGQDDSDLSEQEKALLKAASSLNASPEQIMAAMQLVARRGKGLKPKV